jgi:CheY-like chemotaxis protein
MPMGGRIEISARNVPASEMNPELAFDLDAADFVAIEVTDTGAGMNPETLSKAVEPFYTTKAVGEGSGLGLSMVYGFVRQSGGAIDIASDVGLGTTVKLFLPRTRNVADPPQGTAQRPYERGNGETVLVVEDNLAVKEHARKSLEALGYSVVATETVAAARSVLKQNPGIALVLTDVVLPGGESGYDLYTYLARSHPGLPICLMSGYMKSELEDTAAREAALPLLTKPFSRNELARKVSDLMNGKTP